jgi:hypothetical protein
MVGHIFSKYPVKDGPRLRALLRLQLQQGRNSALSRLGSNRAVGFWGGNAVTVALLLAC